MENGGGELTNVQWKAIQKCHNESPMCVEYILIKMEWTKKEEQKYNLIV
jgi:hypothetical protein